MLIDSGPLIALINRRDRYHEVCATTAQSLPAIPLLTTWPCFTEAMYFLFSEVGYSAQQALWELCGRGAIQIHSLTDTEANRMAELMSQYRDTPMDLADASLVAVAESLSLTEIFTVDSHFHVYRIANSGSFDVFPRSPR